MQKTIFVAICGRPNVGKSTLLNNFLRLNLSATSLKPQTTRVNIRGILTKNDTQIVFIDTPGIITKAKDKMQENIVKNAESGVIGVDLGLFLIDAQKGFTENVHTLAKQLKEKIPELICIINKSDKVKHPMLYKIAQDAYNSGLFTEIFPISAAYDNDQERLLQYVRDRAKEGIWYYDEEDLTDRPNVFIASEITRSAIFELVNKEIPYQADVITDIFEYHEDKILIRQSVIVPRESHKVILLGKKGEMIKKIKKITITRLKKFYDQEIDFNFLIKINPKHTMEL